MKRKRNVYIVDFARLTVPGLVHETYSLCRPFFEKRAGGWAYKAFRRGILAAIENPDVRAETISQLSRGNGPPICQRENAIVAQMYHTYANKLHGQCKFIDPSFDLGEFNLVFNHIAAIQTKTEIRLTYIQPRKNSCPENTHQLALIAAGIRVYIKNNISKFLPAEIDRSFDATLPISIDVFDSGKFSRKLREERRPRYLAPEHIPEISNAAFSTAVDTFSQALKLIKPPPPARKPQEKRQYEDPTQGNLFS